MVSSRNYVLLISGQGLEGFLCLKDRNEKNISAGTKRAKKLT